MRLYFPRPSRRAALLMATIMGLGQSAISAPVQLSEIMPRAGDFTSMWWAEGFPGVIPNASWNRRIQTGSYVVEQDVRTLQFSQLGPLRPAEDYLEFGSNDPPAPQASSPAELTLELKVNGKTYHCRKGADWTDFTGPRLIESGRFMQRADITNLEFVATDGGAPLNVEARFETAAWSDRLGLIFAARPTPPNQWTNASMEIKLTSVKGALLLEKSWKLPENQSWASTDWHQVSLSLDPATFEASEERPSVTVQASEMPNDTALPVDYDPAIGWHRVNLDAIQPIAPPGKKNPGNDAIERVKLILTNPTGREHTARLMFEKSARGFRQRIGSAVTGISATLRDKAGIPTGIPVQISKNWHNKPEGGVYAGAWFHGISQIRLPAGGSVELELTLSYGHWGGVAAASHAQLCLIGWGSNQLWQQSALGSWGESICYEPDQAQANCTITDVRPVMVNSGDSKKSWSWTGNVGGGDFFRFFNPAGKRVPHSAMRTTWQSHGPCLTEVTNSGKLGDGVRHSTSISLARTDDIVRGIYHIRLDVTKAIDFSRFVIFQVGADTYNFTREAKMAIGDESGLTREWDTRFGGNTYRTKPYECTARIPWVSLHEGESADQNRLAGWANRGIVIRSWKARLGGKDAFPWLAEHGVTRGKSDSSTIDIIPPPGVFRLQPGDFVDATIEYIVMPQHAKDYYGPNAALKTALAKDGNTWRMIQREALGNDYAVTMKTGTLERLHPDVRVQTENDAAAFELIGGIGYIPITFTGFTSPRNSTLTVNGIPLDQSVHGNDFWQTDYDPATRTWSRTYNLPAHDKSQHINLSSNH